jgi:AraC family transcriptional activator FtrA
MSKVSCQVHRVGVLVVENTNPFEMGVATEVFGLDRPELPGIPYALDICGPGAVTMRQNFFTLTPSAPLDALADMDTVIVPGHPTPAKAAHPDVLDVLQRSAQNGARMVSFCSGSLLLAEAGLLGGLRATTHWRYADQLIRRFPDVLVEPDVLFVEDGGIFTAAGSAAALDLSLHLVRLDHGEEAMNIVARRLVFAAHRHGDQRQFVDPPGGTEGGPSIAFLQSYVEEHLHESIPVPDLAAVSNMSLTGFHRWFKGQTSMTPQQWVIAQRVARARRLLETSGASVEIIASRSGLGTATNLRQHFRRIVGTTPTAYRTSFEQRASAVG